VRKPLQKVLVQLAKSDKPGMQCEYYWCVSMQADLWNVELWTN